MLPMVSLCVEATVPSDNIEDGEVSNAGSIGDLLVPGEICSNTEFSLLVMDEVDSVFKDSCLSTEVEVDAAFIGSEVSVLEDASDLSFWKDSID